jgi:hypothetical protein
MAKTAPSQFRPIIAAFPSDDEPWRIDWFGRVSYPDRSRRSNNPSICVHLSRVVAPNYQAAPGVLLSPASTAPPERQAKRWVSVGTLALLRVGDVWRRQELDLAPEYELATFQNIEIGTRTVRSLKAGVNPDGGSFLLPNDQHPWHQGNTQSYCVLVSTRRGGRLIIPCVELIRFYFGASGECLNRLFLPGITPAQFYLAKTMDAVRGRLNLQLSPGISGASAPDIARLALDPAAWNAAALVGNSCQLASVEGKPIYPKALFPFIGRTTLTASGKWIDRGDGRPKDFVVFSLRACTHSFPFQSLTYRTSGSKARAIPKSAIRELLEKILGFFLRRSRPRKLVERDPGRAPVPFTAYLGPRDRFPDLIPKPVIEAVPAIAGGEGRGSHQASGEMEGSIGGARGGRPIRSVDPALLQEANEIPKFLKDALQCVLAIKGVSVELHAGDSEDGWTIPAPLQADADGAVREEAFVAPEGEAQRRRRLALLRLKCNSGAAELVVIEANPFYPYLVQAGGAQVDFAVIAKDAMEEFRRSGRDEPASRPWDCAALSSFIAAHFGIAS